VEFCFHSEAGPQQIEAIARHVGPPVRRDRDSDTQFDRGGRSRSIALCAWRWRQILMVTSRGAANTKIRATVKRPWKGPTEQGTASGGSSCGHNAGSGDNSDRHCATSIFEDSSKLQPASDPVGGRQNRASSRSAAVGQRRPMTPISVI
jgi:hypothetical protein